MGIELNPCPFCGGEPSIEVADDVVEVRCWKHAKKSDETDRSFLTASYLHVYVQLPSEYDEQDDSYIIKSKDLEYGKALAAAEWNKATGRFA